MLITELNCNKYFLENTLNVQNTSLLDRTKG